MIAIHVSDVAGRPMTRLFIGCEEMVDSVAAWLRAHSYRVTLKKPTFHTTRTDGEEILAAMLMEQYQQELYHEDDETVH